jgi:serine/threonine protein kinase
LRLAVPSLVGLFDDDREAALPEEVGGYRVVSLLGQGGMGVVYEARQQSPERSVALKLLHPALATPGMRRRFETEAQLLGRLHHPGIVRIFEAGVQEATGPGGVVYRLPFLVLELVRGRRLDDYVSRSGLSLHGCLRLFARICDAVGHAHRQGIVHRDLKPANILVEEGGQPKVLDFGIARVIGPDAETVTPLTATGQILGSFAYMSPEQIGGCPRRVDARSDVYALGVILYQMLAGRLPYEVGRLSVTEAAALIANTRPEPLTCLDQPCRGELEAIVSRAMARDRSRRYCAAARLAAEVRRVERLIRFQGGLRLSR